MLPNRFSRGGSSQTPITPAPSGSAQAPAPEAQAPGDPEEQFQQLLARHEQLQRQRQRRELELEAAERDVAQCAAEAQRLGVQSLEELQALVLKLEAEDRQALLEFEQALEAEATLLATLERDLQALQEKEG